MRDGYTYDEAVIKTIDRQVGGVSPEQRKTLMIAMTNADHNPFTLANPNEAPFVVEDGDEAGARTEYLVNVLIELEMFADNDATSDLEHTIDESVLAAFRAAYPEIVEAASP